jgi:hypothetical protein
MATRKSEDGSRSADAGSESPGSYVKVSGSRRRRKRRGSTMPPPRDSAASEAPRIVDTVAEVEQEPGVEVGIAVDDLRRGSKPSSSRPRKEIGPLGLDDMRTEPPASSVGSDRPRTLNVIEINASEAPRHDPFGEEITTLAPASRLFEDEDEEPVSDTDRELAREYALDDLRPAEQDEPVSLQAVRDVLQRRDSYEALDDRQSMSSVLGARPSLRPSSPMPEKPRDGASVLWWLVVAALVGIIAAAGAIAAREQFASDGEAEPAVAPPEPVVSAPVVEVVKPRPVSFGTPQTAAVKIEPTVEVGGSGARSEAAGAQDIAPRSPASPSSPSVVPAGQSAAVRAGAPYTSAVTGAASAAKPSPSDPGASAVKPTERKTKPAKAMTSEAEPASYAPGYGKPLAGPGFAPGYNAAEPAADSKRGKPDLTPAPEARDNELPGLPINPYE